MVTLDLDPMFIKALRLLHSKAKDSASQLRSMVDEAIAARKAHKLKMEIPETESSEPKKAKHESPSKDDKKEREREKEKLYKKEKEKREQEKERERQEKERLKEQEREKERAQQEELESEESTEEDDKSMNADDFAFDLGVCCQVCSKFDITPKNQLVECQECHALYHQECHKPPVVGDITDPRFVWYCNKCAKTMKKMQHAIQSQKQFKPKPSSAAASSSKDSSSSGSSKPDPLTTAQPFQRTEKKLPSKDPPSSSSSQPFKGLASLAANLTKGSTKAESKALLTGWKTEPVKPTHKDSGGDRSSRLDSSSSKSAREGKGEKSSSSSSGSSSSSSSSGSKSGGGNGGKQPSLSGSTMASANKRLQMMKKTAAAKQQEKRVHIK